MPKKILLIEDEEPMRIVLKNMLEKEGHDVLEANNGKVGMSLYRENGADLVITDILMPEKEGFETIRELKQENPNVKIIAISGGGAIGPEEYLSIAKRLGVHRTFEKPFNREEILEAVNELL